MTKIIAKPPVPIPGPSTNAQLIQAINGYRRHLDEFASQTSANLEWLTKGLQARLDAISKEPS